MTGRSALDYPWWLASRSAAIVAFVLLTAAVAIGLVMAARLAPPRLRPVLRVAHERVALLALAAIGAHGLLLLPDGWLKPSAWQIVVPFTLDYRPLWTGIGVCAAYLAAALALSYYARRRLGARRWRNAHRLIPIAWALAVVHVLGAGTDAGSLWLQAIVALAIAAIVTLGATRAVGRMPRPLPPPAPAPPPPPRAAPAAAPRRPGLLWSDGPGDRGMALRSGVPPRK